MDLSVFSATAPNANKEMAGLYCTYRDIHNCNSLIITAVSCNGAEGMLFPAVVPNVLMTASAAPLPPPPLIAYEGNTGSPAFP